MAAMSSESGLEEPSAEGALDPSPPSCAGALPHPGLVAKLARQEPSKIVVRNTFIDVTNAPSNPPSPVIRSCPNTALLSHARPGCPQRPPGRSPPTAPAGKSVEQLTPTQSTASPGSRPLEEGWSSPLRPFESVSALSGPQAPPWNADLIGELVANAVAVLESHTPTLSNASPQQQRLEGLPLSSPMNTPSWPPSAQAGPLVSVSPTGQPATPGALDPAAMAHSFAAISGFAAIDELEEESGGPDGVVKGAALKEDCWWRALEETPPEQLVREPVKEAETVRSFPSVGSKGHFRRHCKPCAFLYTKGCANGLDCEFCHLCEAGEKKRRTKERQDKRRRNGVEKWQRGYSEFVMRQDGSKTGHKVQVQAADVQPVLPVGQVRRAPAVAAAETIPLPLPR